MSRMGAMAASGARPGGPGRNSRISSGDTRAQRAENAAAPQIPHLFRRIVELFVPYRAQIILTIVLVLAGAALSVIPPLLTQRAFDTGLFPSGGKPNVPVLTTLVVIMVALWLAGAAVGVWQTYLTASVGNRVMGSMRVRLFEHLERMELAFFTKTKTGAIQSRLQNDVGGVSSVLNNTISSVLGNTVTVVAALVAMVLLSWQMTVVAVVLLPFLVLVQRKVGQLRARIAAETQESLSVMTAITQEALSVSGVLLTKSFGQQRAEIGKYDDENRSQIRLQVRQQMSGQWFFAIVQVFLSIIPAIIYVVAAYLILGGVPVSAGTVVAFTTVQSRLLFPAVGLMRVVLDLQTSGALFARVFEYLDLRPAITDSVMPSEIDAAALGSVGFDDVSFVYPDGDTDRPTLDHVSFSIPAGQFAAFVGPSGAGKTTISYLLPRLYEATEGAVLFAGTDVKRLRHDDLIANVGIVSQETYLFHASVEENLRYAKPDATDAELEAAARAANIHDTIASFPDGYRTLVGERGYRLSGGEKQRIAIARVLLKDPAVLILDEATSALDSVSEHLVQQALDTAARGRTTIAIAHRLSTIRAADVIFVIQRGRIAEQGTHAELIARDGVYAALHRQQEEASTSTIHAGVTSGHVAEGPA